MITMERILRRLVGPLGLRVERKNGRPNPYLHLPNWEYQKAWVEPRLRPGDVVLDVGSGHLPCPRAAVLADFFPGRTVHRSGAIVEDRPLVVCSVERLPFRPGAFDFVVCSHVLEHVDSPRRALAELCRVARAGYVETPAYGKDILVGTGNMHRWQVVEFEGTLHFFEYSRRQTEAHVTSPMMDLWTRDDHHPWQDFFWQRQDLFNAHLLWEALPEVVEHRRPGSAPAPLKEWAPVPASQLPDGPRSLTAEEIGLLEARLATPDGARPVRFAGGQFADDGGTVIYPVRGKRVYCETAP
jgi:SAM-dependent methyltransferase